MILTQSFAKKLAILQKLDEQSIDFQKAVVFAFNTLEEQSKVGLQDMLLMDQDKATEIIDVLLKLILYCSKFRTTFSQLDTWLESTPLPESRSKLFKQKLLLYLDKVRGTLHSRQSSETQLKDINWRFQITMSSSSVPNQFKPQVILDYCTSSREHNFLTCNFANLKNLHQQLSAAYKQHDNSANKKVRNSFI